jgi:hypothetical protein
MYQGDCAKRQISPRFQIAAAIKADVTRRWLARGYEILIAL